MLISGSAAVPQVPLQVGGAAVSSRTRGPWLQLGSSRGFEWTQVHLPIPGLPPALEGFRILHLSDFHARRQWDRAYDDLLAGVERNPPDLILFTGDFVDYRYDFRVCWPNVERLLRGLRSRLGLAGILGNHDGDLLAIKMDELKIPLLDQRRLLIQSSDATLELIGLAGVDRDDVDIPFLESLGEKPANSVRIALSHYPDTILCTEFLKPDLYLCGHTHGGQICLPGRIPILRHDKLPRRLCSGVHRFHDTWMITSRGFGFSSMVPLRVFCPAEVGEITLVRGGVP
jgi:predicted MPP superfamily phosphohydrolase